MVDLDIITSATSTRDFSVHRAGQIYILLYGVTVYDYIVGEFQVRTFAPGMRLAGAGKYGVDLN